MPFSSPDSDQFVFYASAGSDEIAVALASGGGVAVTVNDERVVLARPVFTALCQAAIAAADTGGG